MKAEHNRNMQVLMWRRMAERCLLAHQAGEVRPLTGSHPWFLTIFGGQSDGIGIATMTANASFPDAGDAEGGGEAEGAGEAASDRKARVRRMMDSISLSVTTATASSKPEQGLRLRRNKSSVQRGSARRSA